MGLFFAAAFQLILGLFLLAGCGIGIIVMVKYGLGGVLSGDPMLCFVAVLGLGLGAISTYLLGQMGASQGWWGYLF